MCLVDLRSVGAWGDLHGERVRREPAKGGLHLQKRCWRSHSRPPWRAVLVTELLRMTVRDAE